MPGDTWVTTYCGLLCSTGRLHRVGRRVRPLLTGDFVIYDISTDSTGAVKSLDATFVLHCEGGTPAVYGAVRYHA